MLSDQVVSLAVNIGIYAALIAFVLYRQMREQPVRGRRLVLMPAVLGVFGVQQLVSQPSALDGGTLAFLAVGLVIGVVAGVWRGTTFRLWPEAGRVMVRGTAMTVVSWAVLIAVRVPFAFLGRAAGQPLGFVTGELLLALAVTFAAQNTVLWARAQEPQPRRSPGRLFLRQR